jgi:hypothetical protein
MGTFLTSYKGTFSKSRDTAVLHFPASFPPAGGAEKTPLFGVFSGTFFCHFGGCI